MRVKFEEKISQNSPSKSEPDFLSSGSIRAGNSKLGSGALHLEPGSINYDDVLDVIRNYPTYKSYFSEKLAKVAELENRILKPELRGYGETKIFLKKWRGRFIQQINFMTTYLKKDKQNGQN